MKCERCGDGSLLFGAPSVTFHGAGTYHLCAPCRRYMDQVLMLSAEWRAFRLADLEYARYQRGVSTLSVEELMLALEATERGLWRLVRSLVESAKKKE